MSIEDRFWLLAWTVSAAMFAVGCVLAIRINHRLQAAQRHSAFHPAHPLSRADARQMIRSYFRIVITIAAAGLCLGLFAGIF